MVHMQFYSVDYSAFIAAEKEMEKITSGYIEQVDKLVENKENELMEV